MGKFDTITVNLVYDQLKMSQSLNMAIFNIIDWRFENKLFKDDKRGISMVVTMKRKITSELMTTYFPSLLLTAITFATTFFKPIFFEAALSVNLTTMLVMTTIFTSKMEGLPPTSDIKMIDIWLVLCQMVPFAEVVLLTAMEYYRDDDGTEDHNDLLRPLSVGVGVGVFDDSEGKRCQGCKTPRLKTIGDNQNLLTQIYNLL